jgi:hypothetical protein
LAVGNGATAVSLESHESSMASVLPRLGLFHPWLGFLAIKRDGGVDFLGCEGLGIGFADDQFAEGAFGETDSLVNVRSP